MAIGAVAREVRAASLLAILLSLPLAFLALVPSGAVAGGLYDVIRVVCAVFPFKPTLEAMDAAINGSSPTLGASLVHLLIVAAGFAVARARGAAAVRVRRAGRAAPLALASARVSSRGWPIPRRGCAGCASVPPARPRARDRAERLALRRALFVTLGRDSREPIGSMPGVDRLSIGAAVQEAGELAALGVPAVLLFGLPDHKDEEGSGAWDDEGVVQLATRAIKEAHPDLLVITDVCLCEYTSHGHCGVLRPDGTVDNDASVALIARTAVSHARAGADIVAPSDMMDGRVGALRGALDLEGFADTPILAYSAKFASAFYGPFREAAESTPAFGDRRGYQMDPGNAREALREALLDVAGGRRHGDGQAGARLPRRDRAGRASAPSCRWPPTTSAASTRWSRRPPPPGTSTSAPAALEMLTAIRRAGADIIITYYAKEAAAWLQ